MSGASGSKDASEVREEEDAEDDREARRSEEVGSAVAGGELVMGDVGDRFKVCKWTAMVNGIDKQC